MPRIEVENGVYHVIARGNERRAIFADSADRERFMHVLGHASSRYGCVVLAYCLMTNHYHLLLQTPNANLSRVLRQLNGVYAQAFNRRHGRDGHLFQGRYVARLVQADDHLLTVLRYIVRNPVRAGMSRLDQWPWSSHLAMLGSRPAGFLASDRLLSYLGESRDEARARYLALVEHGEEASIGSVHPLIEGDERFLRMQLARVRASPEHPRSALRMPRRPLTELVASSAQTEAIAQANAEHGYSMREIASHLGCGVATVHRRIRAYETGSGTRGTRGPDASSPERGRPDPWSRPT